MVQRDERGKTSPREYGGMDKDEEDLREVQLVF